MLLGGKTVLNKLTWLGHAGFFYSGPPRIYIDPFRIAAGPIADLVLLTHPHYDHCSPDALRHIVGPDTEILCPPDCLTSLSSLPGTRRIVEPGTRVELKNVRIEAIPAYTRKSRMHGRENAWVGYVVQIDGTRIYHAGDTDYIPEMRALQVDVACLPISGGETMTVVEAAAAANSIAPQVVVPMHYGTLGDDIDPDLFGNLTRITVHALERDLAFAGE
jgi:L-ascorbate metabolism protein UlaG (beta-lactamase superfamily)